MISPTGHGRGGAAFCAVLLGAWLAWVAAPVPAWGDDGRINSVEVTQDEDGVSVSARLSGRIPNKVVREIRQGVPKDLFYTVTLNRRHRNWFDEELVASTVQYTIKYDTLEGRYHIHRIAPDGETSDQVVATYTAAVEAIFQISGVHLERPSLPGDYYVRVKAEMRSVRLPLYLDYVFFFIPILEFETPWSQSVHVVR